MRWAWAVAALAWPGVGWAQAAPGLLCGRAAVLAEVESALQQAGRRVRLDPVAVGEYVLGPERVVHCAVRAHLPGYDTVQRGVQPVDVAFTIRYALELRHNGIFVSLE